MKTFIINSWKGALSQKKKNEISTKLTGREWRMLTDELSVTAKYIFLKEDKLLISLNGLSSYSQWHMATESSLVMDEGIATLLYKVVHLDDNLLVLNLDGTDNFCFLTNDSSTVLPNPSLEDIQWYLYRHCNIDILSQEQKQIIEREKKKRVEEYQRALEQRRKEEAEEEILAKKVSYVLLGIVVLLILVSAVISSH